MGGYFCQMLLNNLLNMYDRYDDEGWVKECKKHAWLAPFHERIHLAFLFQQDLKLTSYASDIQIICPMAS